MSIKLLRTQVMPMSGKYLECEGRSRLVSFFFFPSNLIYSDYGATKSSKYSLIGDFEKLLCDVF